MYWFTFLFVPLFPICVYVVEAHSGTTFRFLGQLALSDFHSIYRDRLPRFYLMAVVEGVLIVAGVIAMVTAFAYLRYAISN